MKPSRAMPRLSPFVRSHLKTRHLVLLVELGRHGSIGRAAAATGITQSVASRLLDDMERSLGVRLFERLPRGVTPTPHGNLLVRRASAALAEMRAAHAEVAALADGCLGSVAIGAILTPAATLVPPAIALLKSRHGALHVSVAVDTSAALLEGLALRKYDIVIGRISAAGQASGLDFVPCSDEPHGIIARAGHPVAGYRGLPCADVASFGWIMPPEDSQAGNRLHAAFLAAGVQPPAATVTCASFDATLGLLAGTDLVAPLPLELVWAGIGSGHLQRLDVDIDLRLDAYGIVTHRHHQPSPAAAAMLTALSESMERQGRGRISWP